MKEGFFSLAHPNVLIRDYFCNAGLVNNYTDGNLAFEVNVHNYQAFKDANLIVKARLYSKDDLNKPIATLLTQLQSLQKVKA